MTPFDSLRSLRANGFGELPMRSLRFGSIVLVALTTAFIACSGGDGGNSGDDDQQQPIDAANGSTDAATQDAANVDANPNMTPDGGGIPGFDGGFPSFDGGFPSFDGGFPSFDGGFPSFDGGFPSFAGGIPGWDGGLPF